MAENRVFATSGHEKNGESGIRTRGTGCNPYTGLANRLDNTGQIASKPASDKPLPRVDASNPEAVLADCLALFSENDPRLALIIRAWNRLDDDVRESLSLKAEALSCELAICA